MLDAALSSLSGLDFETGLICLKVITAILAAICLISTIAKISAKGKKKGSVSGFVLFLSYAAAAASLAVTLYTGTLVMPEKDAEVFLPLQTEPVVLQTVPAATEPEPTVIETEAPTEPPVIFAPAMTDLTNPENFGLEWDIIQDEQIVESFQRAEPISFGDPDDYFALPGICTFRGNNYRNNATYGTATVSAKKLTRVWSHGIGQLDDWGGCAWTGQPLVVQWDDETKAIMNLYDSKKSKEGLVEVIYATLDGKVHFYDMEDGKETRKPIDIGMNFKGAGALDPRGYPLLYVGGGLYTNGLVPRMFIVNLITGEIIYRHGHKETFHERDWIAFDSSPLVDAETDTLIWPS